MFEIARPDRHRRAPLRVTPRDGAPAWIYDFGLQRRRRRRRRRDPRALPRRASRASGTARRSTTASTALIVAAGLDWREVTVLRSVARYLRQAGIPFSDRYMEQTLLAPPRRRGGARRALPRALRSRPGDRGRRGARGRARSSAAIDAVESLDEDRILRGFLSRRAGDAAHELLPAGTRSRTCRSSSTRRRSRWCRCRGRVRDLRALAAGRGRAPARRHGRARRPALVATGARTSAPRSSG